MAKNSEGLNSNDFQFTESEAVDLYAEKVKLGGNQNDIQPLHALNFAQSYNT